MTLETIEILADTAPTNARAVILFDPVDAVTLNTDLIFSVSRDGGTTFTDFTVTYEADYDANVQVLTTDDLDISAQPSGTSMVLKATTANNKELQIHGWWLQWR